MLETNRKSSRNRLVKRSETQARMLLSVFATAESEPILAGHCTTSPTIFRVTLDGWYGSMTRGCPPLHRLAHPMNPAAKIPTPLSGWCPLSLKRILFFGSEPQKHNHVICQCQLNPWSASGLIMPSWLLASGGRPQQDRHSLLWRGHIQIARAKAEVPCPAFKMELCGVSV